MKKLYFLILTTVFFVACNQNNQKKEPNKEVKIEKQSETQEALLVVNYELENMSLEDHAKLGAEVAPNFTSENIQGLIGKTFIGNIDKGVFGGVFGPRMIKSIRFLEVSPGRLGALLEPTRVFLGFQNETKVD